MQRLQRQQRGIKGEKRTFLVVGQSVLCIALNIAALIPVLTLLFTVDITVSGIGLTGEKKIMFFS